MKPEIIIETTVLEVVKIIQAAAGGLERYNREASLAMLGSAQAIQKKSKEITAQVVEKLDL